jgi:hypothetical protein
MRRTQLLSMLPVFLVLAISATTASACLNDRETKSREIEFKAQYTPSINPASSEPAADEGSPSLDNLLMGAGGILGLTGLGIGMRVGITGVRKPI